MGGGQDGGQDGEGGGGTERKIRILNKWTKVEDDFLREGVAEFGKGKWKEILEKYKDKFHESRDRFSVRLRYGYLEKMGKVPTEPNMRTDNLNVMGASKEMMGLPNVGIDTLNVMGASAEMMGRTSEPNLVFGRFESDGS